MLMYFQYFGSVKEKDVEKSMIERKEIDMAPVKQTIDEELVSFQCTLK